MALGSAWPSSWLVLAWRGLAWLDLFGLAWLLLGFFLGWLGLAWLGFFLAFSWPFPGFSWLFLLGMAWLVSHAHIPPTAISVHVRVYVGVCARVCMLMCARVCGRQQATSMRRGREPGSAGGRVQPARGFGEGETRCRHPQGEEGGIERAAERQEGHAGGREEGNSGRCSSSNLADMHHSLGCWHC